MPAAPAAPVPVLVPLVLIAFGVFMARFDQGALVSLPMVLLVSLVA